LFWVAFLVWGLCRLQVACQKVLESAGKWKKVLKSENLGNNVLIGKPETDKSVQARAKHIQTDML